MSKVFNAYAEYYDLLYKDKDYSKETSYLHKFLQQANPQAHNILELGCGTGAHAEQLAKKGYSVHGIDLSPAMVEKAIKRKENLPADIANRLSFSVGDVRDTRLNQKFDTVLSLFHVMSYQTSNDDLSNTLETAYLHLHNHGLFIFDYWYGPAVLTDQPVVRVKRLENNNIRVMRIAEPVMHYDSNVVDVNYTVQISEKETELTETFIEKHAMRYLFLPEIKQLSIHKFSILEQYAWLELTPPTPKKWAAVTLLKKIQP